MAIKSIFGALPGIVAGLSMGAADANPTLPGENLQAEAGLDQRITAVREHFHTADRVEVRNAGITLAWYNWNNSFDNWDNGRPER